MWKENTCQKTGSGQCPTYDGQMKEFHVTFASLMEVPVTETGTNKTMRRSSLMANNETAVQHKSQGTLAADG